VPEPVQLGPVSQKQGCSQAAQAVGPERRNPSVYPHQRRQDARCQRAGLHADRSQGVLRHGSRLLGLHPTLRHAPSMRTLRHPSQSQHGHSAHLFQTNRQNSGCHLRPEGAAQRHLRFSELPGESAPHSIQRSRYWQDADLSDQQLCVATADCGAIQKPLAGRIVLQVDQTAPAYQEVPGQQRERRQGANMVHCVDLRTDCHRQNGTSN